MATITSTQTGDWHVTGTWVGGVIPANNDLVVIAHGHKVTLSTNIQAAITDNVTIDGNLHFADGGKMHLNGRMTVKNTSNSSNNAGEFVSGTTSSGSLLSMVGGSEIKISGDNSAQHGIQIDARKWCGVQLDGSEPTANTQLNGSHVAGSTYLTVDSTTGFASGDMISLYDYDVDYRYDADECFYVHDVDAGNNRLYLRQFTPPTAIVQAKNGSTIKLDDAAVFRVGYKIAFGTGGNRNVLEITGISGNIVTFGSSVAGTVDGETAYMGYTEKTHADNRKVRKLASSLETAITSINSTNQITLNNASDFTSGDVLSLEPQTANGDNRYVSGSETNHWRHQILYTVQSKSSNTLTLDRNIPYLSDAGSIVVKMTRDINIKACAANGDEVADGDSSTARVFFNVKYWTSNGWNAASTRRCRIKNVYFKNLGYNSSDSTNFRGGVTIGGYNGRYRSDITGSAEDNSTIHSSGGVSQTGENYVSGCTVTAYSLTCNTVSDGDSYPSLVIRHPYGMVVRNNVTVGTGRGLWRWSSGYFTKLSGHISMVSNYANSQVEALYSEYSFVSYFYLRMCEDYGFMVYNTGQNKIQTIRHIDVQLQSTALYFGSNLSGSAFDRIYLNRYKLLNLGERINNVIFTNSKFMPNRWDGSNPYYGGDSGVNYSNYVNHNSSGYHDDFRADGKSGRIIWYDQGYVNGEMVEMGKNLTRIKKRGTKYWDYLIATTNRKNFLDNIYVPANTTVKLRSVVMINAKTLTNANTSTSPSSNDLPWLYAKPMTGGGWNGGRHISGASSWSGVDNHDMTNNVNDWRSSADAQGKLLEGFLEAIPHTASCVGSFETKDLTIAPQKESYILCFGYVIDSNGLKSSVMHAKDIQVTMNNVHPGAGSSSMAFGKKIQSRSSFNTGKKRISGRI